MSTPTTFGATVVGKETETTQPARTPAVSQYSFDLTETRELVPPVSPFYQHPPASHERVSKFDKSLDVNVAEKGLIDGLTPISTKSDPFSSAISVSANKECPMWPSKQTLVNANMAEKRRKRDAKWCAFGGPRHFWAGLHKRQKLIISLAVALLVIGAMIGLGVGINKSVNGHYYSPSA